MNDRTASRLAWSVWGLGAVLAAVGCVLVWINSGATPIARGDLVFDVFIAIAGVVYATVGALIASRRHNAVGWILLFIGATFALTAFLIQYAVRGLAGTGSLSAARYAAWASTWVWTPAVGALDNLRDLARGIYPPLLGRPGAGGRMADRLAALGGSIEVQSTPGAGTAVRGSIPVSSREQ